MKTEPYILIDKQDRKVLIEGRSTGMGYGFCKREGTTFTTVSPISACKDYLSDVVWSEATGGTGSWYGLTVKKLGLFAEGKGYLATRILPDKYGNRYNEQELHEKALEVGYKTNVQASMNWFERSVGLKEFTNIEPTTTPGVFIVELPSYWLQNMPLISLAGWIMRVAMRGWDEKEPLKSLAASANTDFQCDAYYQPKIIPKMERMIKGEVIKCNPADHNFAPHGFGIVGFSF